MTARSTTSRFPLRPVYEEAAPFSAMNITPLIDVLLVLLVMMILTIPIMTHKVPVDLPQPGVYDDGSATTHRIMLTAAGGDGAPIAEAALPARLASFMQEDNARLQIQADAALRYERFDQVLATIRRAGVTRLGFVGNERFADFSAAPL
ncbi:ExbD/TolR family protein [Sphingomonas qilianensis]|uniref:Biopolymer transporter ExbD n=1 Tax=Sphingomonas qilianensis TaxID=1736690 RepID=A0ABU9XUA9_9SPHN